MVPSGPPTPVGSGQSGPPSVLRSSSGMLGVQGGSLQSQSGFPSLVSPRNQFNSMNMLNSSPNMPAGFNQSFGNMGPNSAISGAEIDQLSSVGFNGQASYVVNPGSSGQIQGQQFSNLSANQMLQEQQQSQRHETQRFQPGQNQFSPHSSQQVQQQQQFHSRGIAGIRPVKMEPHVTNDQHGQPQPQPQQQQQQQQQQQLQALRNLGPVKLEPQQLQTMRNLPPVKMERQQTDQSMLQQQQQFFHMSRQSSQAATAQMNLLHQQRLMQLRHQQFLKAMPQQRPQLPQQFQPQGFPLRQPVKSVYEPGMCAQRLTQYMYQQQQRPEDNNIEFWRKFVAEYFSPNAKKRWCVSMYGNGRQTTGVFPQDVWHCEICNQRPGRGFEATAEVLPRLFKIKYESGTLEELLYVDMPQEYQNPSGQIVLDYAKAIQESVFEKLRVVRDGQLRIVFSPDLKICSWEFCARHHEELIPRRLLIPQVSQLGSAAQKYQQAAVNATSNPATSELQNNCNMFVASARQLAKALEVPLVNDLGYTKRYVRCLQISEVVNSMKDLIDYSRETGTGPIESLVKFPRRTNTSSGSQGQAQQPEQQQQPRMSQNSNADRGSVRGAAPQVTASSGVANAFNAAPGSTSASTITGLVHQNSMNSRQPNNSANNAASPYGANPVQMPSPSSSSTVPQSQHSHSPFHSPTISSNNNPLPQPSQHGLASNNHVNSPANMPVPQPAPSGEADPSDSQGSVQKILHEIMMHNQMNGMVAVGAGFRNDVKNGNGILPGNNNHSVPNGGNSLVSNGPVNNNSSGGDAGFGAMVGMNGIRGVMGNNSLMNGRVSAATMAREQSMLHQQHDIGSQLLSGMGAANGFNNLQFDWKPSP